MSKWAEYRHEYESTEVTSELKAKITTAISVLTEFSDELISSNGLQKQKALAEASFLQSLKKYLNIVQSREKLAKKHIDKLKRIAQLLSTDEDNHSKILKLIGVSKRTRENYRGPKIDVSPPELALICLLSFSLFIGSAIFLLFVAPHLPGDHAGCLLLGLAHLSLAIALGVSSFIAYLYVESHFGDSELDELEDQADLCSEWLIIEERFNILQRKIRNIGSDLEKKFEEYQKSIFEESSNIATSYALFVIRSSFYYINHALETDFDWTMYIRRILREDKKVSMVLWLELLKYKYKQGSPTSDANLNKILDALLNSSLPPESVANYLERYKSIQNRSKRGFFALFSSRETVDDLVNEITGGAWTEVVFRFEDVEANTV